MNCASTSKGKIAAPITANETQCCLYQSVPMNEELCFNILDLAGNPLAQLMPNHDNPEQSWLLTTSALTVPHAKALGDELNSQHYSFRIKQGRFLIYAHNLLDGHYLCNTLALEALSERSITTMIEQMRLEPNSDKSDHQTVS